MVAAAGLRGSRTSLVFHKLLVSVEENGHQTPGGLDQTDVWDGSELVFLARFAFVSRFFLGL